MAGVNAFYGTFAVFFSGVCCRFGWFWKHLPEICTAFVVVLALADHICRVFSPAFVVVLAGFGNICREYTRHLLSRNF
ncbi:hypothetical protein HXT52_04455 [Gardnerella sp. KA00288]|uniref:hypothetical protein n=1 Tax=Gardnerella TaxID=2701 RepID=UPI0012BAA2C4|nr:hypothetical protein [Gardnerella vaginalis]